MGNTWPLFQVSFGKETAKDCESNYKTCQSGDPNGMRVGNYPKAPSTTQKPLDSSVVKTENKPVREATGAKRKECGVQNPLYGFHNGFKVYNADPDDSDTLEGEFPWMLLIKEVRRSNKSHQGFDRPVCGGSLLQANVAITAAHCVVNLNMENIVVRAAEWDLQKNNEAFPPQDRLVSKLIVHPRFTARPFRFDIALLFFYEPFELNEAVNTICLPESEDNLILKSCIATGWGNKLQDLDDRTLKRATLPVVPYESCSNLFRTAANLSTGFTLHRTFLCAGGVKDIDTCLGDGGGPLTCPSILNKNKHYQVGITSWGIGDCGRKGSPGAYTNITYMKSWIRNTVKNFEVTLNKNL